MCHPGLIYPSKLPCKTNAIVKSLEFFKTYLEDGLGAAILKNGWILNVLGAAVLKSRVGGNHSGQWAALEDVSVYL